MHRRLGRRPRAPASCVTPTDDPQLVLVATGSEVALCVDAADALAARRRRRARREPAVVGPLRAAGRDVPRRRCCPPACRCCRSRRRRRSAGSAAPTTRSASTASAPARPATSCSTSSASTSTTSSTRAQALLAPERGEVNRMNRLQRPVPGARPEPVARQPQARLPHLRPARRAARPRHPRPHVEPDDLPEGDPGLEPTTTSSSRELAADEHPVIDDYWALVLADIHGALRRVRRRSYDAVRRRSTAIVSVEVAPSLAHDSAGTVAAARDLHERDRPAAT